MPDRPARARRTQLLAWWAVSDTTDAQLTRDTYDRLQAELEDLTTRGRVEIAAAIEAARALGDLSENGDYHAAKDAQGKMESRSGSSRRCSRRPRWLMQPALRRDGGPGHGGEPPLRR